MQADKRDEDKTREELTQEVKLLRRLLAKLVDFEKEEKLLLEKMLQESEERFREIFDQHYDALLLLDRGSLKCLDANPMAENLFDYDLRELMIDFSRIFKDEHNYDKFRGIVCDTEHRDFFIERIPVINRRGEEITCGFRGKIIRIREQDVLYCSFRDIREKIEAEEKERYIQAKLVETNKMTSLGTLASGIAHEINNPNNFILTNTQMFSDIWEDAQKILQERYEREGDFSLAGLSYAELVEMGPKLLSGAIEGSLRISNIIKSLKEFSRPVDNRLQEWVDVNGVITFSLSILKGQIKKYTDSFEVNLGKDLPRVQGNPQQIEQVIINLVQNALHALPDKNRGIVVSSFYQEESGYVIIKIKDRGIGMEKDIVERITEPFFTTKKKSGGTGLGLYISYSIIKRHNGILDIESEPGVGTEVLVKLPGFLDANKNVNGDGS